MDSAEAMAEWANDLQEEVRAELFALHMCAAVLFGGIRRLSPDVALGLAEELRNCSTGAMPAAAALRLEAVAREWAALVQGPVDPAEPI